jgi:catechol 2,3-dioxygenase-like lactoylglutathione lyase family enzyme
MCTGRSVNGFIAVLTVFVVMGVTNQSSFADANTPDITGLAHICVYTRDMSKSLVFYTDTLGFEVVHSTRLDAGYGFAMVRRGSCIIELLEPEDVNKTKPRTGGVVDHVALEVKDINTVFAKLKAKGVSFTTPIIDDPNLMGGVRIAFFRGPSGESFELFEYLKPVPAIHGTKAAKD